MQREVIAAATSTYPNGQVDDGAESDLLAEELIAAEPVTITGTESPGNKGTPPAGGDWPGAFWWNGSATT